MSISDELRAAAQHIRATPRCTTYQPDCDCDFSDMLADALDVQAARGETEGVVDTYLLEVARKLNAKAGAA